MAELLCYLGEVGHGATLHPLVGWSMLVVVEGVPEKWVVEVHQCVCVLCLVCGVGEGGFGCTESELF